METCYWNNPEEREADFTAAKLIVEELQPYIAPACRPEVTGEIARHVSLLRAPLRLGAAPLPAPAASKCTCNCGWEASECWVS